MTPLASAISSALIHFVWQASIVAILLSITFLALRKRSPNSRYVAGCAALVLMALLPVVTAWILYSSSGTGAEAGPTGVSLQSVVGVGIDLAGKEPWAKRLQDWALPVWSFGVLLFSLRLVFGYQHALLLRRRGKPASESVGAVVQRLQKLMSIRRRIQVLISPASDSPSVVGWLRPVILLPSATLLGLTPLQLEAILAHEIGHIRRYDYLVNMLQMLVETLLFYHPAVWWTSRRVRLERELCCDDLAVRFSGNALRYARALTTLEKLRLRSPSTVMASTGGPLLYRIQRLAGVAGKEHGPSRLPIVLAAGLGLLCLTLNVSWIQGQDAPGVTVDLGASSVIHRTPVRYPEAAQKQGINGSVQLEVKLDSTGNVSDARVVAGPEELRKAALESVLNWHFTSDAARDTRLVTISFSDEGTQVQVQEPQNPRNRPREFNDVEAAALFEEITSQARSLEQAAVLERNMDRLRELERAAALLQRRLIDSNGIRTEDHRVLAVELEALHAQIQVLQARTEAEQMFAGRSRRGTAVPTGREIRRITTTGLSDAVRNELIARLPVREGDILSQQSLELIASAVRSYDEHLRVQYVPTDDDQAEIQISAPGERR